VNNGVGCDHLNHSGDRRPSNSRRLLSDLCNSWNISINDFLSFIHAGGWRLRDSGLDEQSLKLRGYQR
jgi:hypothetical protein